MRKGYRIYNRCPECGSKWRIGAPLTVWFSGVESAMQAKDCGRCRPRLRRYERLRDQAAEKLT